MKFAFLSAKRGTFHAKLCGLTCEELSLVRDLKDVYCPGFCDESLRILREKKERELGEFGTGHLILEAWDEI